MVNVRNLMRLENFHHKIKKAFKQSRKKLHSNSTEISSLPNRKLIMENVTVKKCQLNQIDNMEFTKQIHTQINISLKWPSKQITEMYDRCQQWYQRTALYCYWTNLYHVKNTDFISIKDVKDNKYLRYSAGNFKCKSKAPTGNKLETNSLLTLEFKAEELSLGEFKRNKEVSIWFTITQLAFEDK